MASQQKNVRVWVEDLDNADVIIQYLTEQTQRRGAEVTFADAARYAMRCIALDITNGEHTPPSLEERLRLLEERLRRTGSGDPELKRLLEQLRAELREATA